MINDELRILIEAYTDAANDGDTGAAETLLQELESMVILSQHDRVKAEKIKGWTVG